MGENEEFISRYVDFETITGLTNGQLKLGVELKERSELVAWRR